jgi:RimJ/RimL family protein N-acetyltransferase
VSPALRVTPRLRDGVLLREFRESDIPPFLASFAADPEQGRLMGFETDPVEAEALAELREIAASAERGEGMWLTVCDEADAPLGCIWVPEVKWKHKRLELGLLVFPEARGRGVGTRAIEVACDWAFGELGFERVIMETTSDNAGMRAVAARAGFQEEGVMRSHALERGRRVDIVVLGRLRQP